MTDLLGLRPSAAAVLCKADRIQLGMAMTTRVLTVSIPVADQDRALAFYTEVLGCELRPDVEVWPGARLVEVVSPGSAVGLVLLPHDSEIPMAVRMGTTDAEAAHAQLSAAGATLHNEEVVHLEDNQPADVLLR
jgi:catechol 2,3-dioxygenase-like lactoylglutathione lyase family enzyme